MKILLTLIVACWRRAAKHLARRPTAKPTVDIAPGAPTGKGPGPQGSRRGSLLVFADGHRLIRRSMTPAEYDREEAFAPDAVRIELGEPRQ